jgi:hypothetical protein
MSKITLGDMVGDKLEEEFVNFDLTEIQNILQNLQNEEPIDLAHAEMLQQQTLRAADILSEYLGKIVKTVAYLESKTNSTKNKASLNYSAPDGGKTTNEMRKWWGESAPEVEEIQIRLAKAKASKMVLEKKFDIMIRYHHNCKDISAGLRKTILGYTPTESIAQGY